MNRRRASSLAVIAFCVLAAVPVRAQTVQETMATAWEALWQQSGFPIQMRKWSGGAIRVRFTDDYDRGSRAYVLAQLRSVADVVGIPVTDDSDGPANLEITIDPREAAIPANAPCHTLNASRRFVIFRSNVRANPSSIHRCMLHESMHVMGFSGHPAGHSVLTYFNRGRTLTATDKLLLRTLYSDDVTPGMSPLHFMMVLGSRLEAATLAPDRPAARAAVSQFFQGTLREMQAFADGSGDPPAILIRTARTTGEGLARGRLEAQYLLGDAYLNGHGVERDTDKAVQWLSRAAAGAHAGAIRLLGMIQTKP